MFPHNDEGEGIYLSFFFFFFSHKKFQVFVNLEKYSSRVFGLLAYDYFCRLGASNRTFTNTRIILTKLTLSR